jgi:hypothetical protein
LLGGAGLIALAALGGTMTSTGALHVGTNEIERDDQSSDPLKHALWMATFEGVWSAALTVGWAVQARSLEKPQPESLAGLLAARVLYGTSWSWLLVAETTIAYWLTGPEFRGLSDVSLTTDWLIGVHVPANCPEPCGFGLGGYSQLRARIAGPPEGALVFALSGGWIQGRVADAPDSTVIQSTWIQSPASLRSQLGFEMGPVLLELEAGPGVYYGMNNAHVHPKSSAVSAPWHQFVPLSWGLGPGAYFGARLSLLDAVFVAGEFELASLLAGGSAGDLPRHLASFAGSPVGSPMWRRTSVGVGLTPTELAPIAVSVRWWMAELSTRPLSSLGHHALLLRFQVPVDIGSGDSG